MLRVVQWATGTVGIHAVPGIVSHPQLELVGLWVNSEHKVGVDAGTLCGVEPVGISATNDAALLLDAAPDAICYMANSDLRPDGVIDDLCTFLSRGINVVNTSFVPLLNPAAMNDDTADRLRAACATGNASIYTSGIDPGFGNVGLAVHMAALCKEIQTIRMMEIVNYATWDNPFTMFEIMGFGKERTDQSLLLSPGSTALAWGPVVELVASAINLKLDGIEEWHEIIRADEPIEIASGVVEPGTISGMRFEIRGMVGGVARIVVEHVTRLRDEDAPDWPHGSGYRIVIDGEPCLRAELELSSHKGDHNHAGCLATAMHVINAIPDVVAADPGILTLLDLPVYSADCGG